MLMQVKQLSKRVYFPFPKVIFRAPNNHHVSDKSRFKEIKRGHRTSVTGLIAKARTELEKEDGGTK